MHRRTLVLRRFHDLSFGLGYFEDGAWIDHAAPMARALLAEPSAAEQEALDAIHTWFDCCGEPAAAIAVIEEAPVAALSPT